MHYIRPFETLSKNDVPIVGGKNASLGEMISTLKSQGIRVPDGFATTAEAYWAFLEHNHLKEKIAEEKDGKTIREWFLQAEFPPALAQEITAAYKKLGKNADVAVRSSATAEDLPDASFAGQQETFLHVRGPGALLDACRKCYASLFKDRAIAYRAAKNFEPMKVALSIGVQKMVRSDKGSSGVIFTLDPDSGFPRTVVINAAWGLGENVVQGSINPDEYVVFKPTLSIIGKKLGKKEQKLIYHNSETKNVNTPRKQQASFALSDADIIQLAKWSIIIENHYGRPMDIEWAKDGITDELYLVQARPETVHSLKHRGEYKNYVLKEKGKPLLHGLAIGDMIAAGKVQVIASPEHIEEFQPGSILVTRVTSPDWVPIMKKAAGIITDLGGRTSHAAIVSRELGVPAIVGTATATHLLKTDQEITLCCSEGEQGTIYEGKLRFEAAEISLEALPTPSVPLMLNISSPEEAFRFWRLPCSGIGLARMEFIINNIIQIHPMALVHFDQVKDKKERRLIEKLTKGYTDRKDYFVQLLGLGIARIAAARYPDPVIVRMSDFKT
ncbi:MAG: phosphoenolpyruvate synthase, partial [Verrucomicrobia bacterium]|nr:phosphoenolpyruvate synthase [Verrucomicrobiota bacterium]